METKEEYWYIVYSKKLGKYIKFKAKIKFRNCSQSKENRLNK